MRLSSRARTRGLRPGWGIELVGRRRRGGWGLGVGKGERGDEGMGGGREMGGWVDGLGLYTLCFGGLGMR